MQPASWNRWRYANPQVDEWLRAARANLVQGERAELHGLVQDQLAVDLPAIPLHGSHEMAAQSANVTGYVAHPIQYILDALPGRQALSAFRTRRADRPPRAAPFSPHDAQLSD